MVIGHLNNWSQMVFFFPNTPDQWIILFGPQPLTGKTFWKMEQGSLESVIFTVQWLFNYWLHLCQCCYHLFQSLTMSQIPSETSVVQPNGLSPEQPSQSQEPVVSFSHEGVDPSVNVVPPPNEASTNQLPVITWYKWTQLKNLVTLRFLSSFI